MTTQSRRGFSSERLLALAIVIGMSLALAGVASAQNGNRQYSATFTNVVDNCKDQKLSLTPATISVSFGDDGLLMKIPPLPDLSGKAGRKGKLRASGSKKEGTKTTKFSVSGRSSETALQAVLVAELFEGETPVCTQSWAVKGTKK